MLASLAPPRFVSPHSSIHNAPFWTILEASLSACIAANNQLYAIDKCLRQRRKWWSYIEQGLDACRVLGGLGGNSGLAIIHQLPRFGGRAAVPSIFQVVPTMLFQIRAFLSSGDFGVGVYREAGRFGGREAVDYFSSFLGCGASWKVGSKLSATPPVRRSQPAKSCASHGSSTKAWRLMRSFEAFRFQSPTPVLLWCSKLSVAAP